MTRKKPRGVVTKKKIQGPIVSAARVGEFIAAKYIKVAKYQRQLVTWTDSAQHLATAVAGREAMREQREVFGIRLAGVLSDLRSRFAGREEFAKEMQGRDTPMSGLIRDLNAAIDVVYRSLTEDELLWIERYRHEQCHPALDSYQPRLTDDADWNARTVAIIDGPKQPGEKRPGEKRQLDDIELRCDNLERVHGTADGVLEMIAGKTATPLADVHACMIRIVDRLTRIA